MLLVTLLLEVQHSPWRTGDGEVCENKQKTKADYAEQGTRTKWTWISFCSMGVRRGRRLKQGISGLILLSSSIRLFRIASSLSAPANQPTDSTLISGDRRQGRKAALSWVEESILVIGATIVPLFQHTTTNNWSTQTTSNLLLFCSQTTSPLGREEANESIDP